jgi:SH3 domain-containing YSC84-like protein 1
MTSLLRFLRHPLSVCCLFAAAALLAAPPAGAETTDKYLTRFETCEAIIREFQDDPQLAIPAAVLQKAHAIVIVNQVQGGLILGAQYGYGAVLVRRADGKWSIPVLVKAGGASLGFQLGGRRAETVYIFTEDTAPRKLYAGHFDIDLDARAVAGPRAYEPEKITPEILAFPVLVYGRGQGYYAGATVAAGWLDRNDAPNQAYYKTHYTMPELLYGDFIGPTAGVRPLMDFIAAITR